MYGETATSAKVCVCSRECVHMQLSCEPTYDYLTACYCFLFVFAFQLIPYSRTEQEEVAEGVFKCQFYIKFSDGIKFGSLQQLYKYHETHPVTQTDTAGTHSPPDTRYQACLVTPMHSLLRATARTSDIAYEYYVPPGPRSSGGQSRSAAPLPRPTSIVTQSGLQFAVPSEVGSTPAATHAAEVRHASLPAEVPNHAQSDPAVAAVPLGADGASAAPQLANVQQAALQDSTTRGGGALFLEASACFLRGNNSGGIHQAAVQDLPPPLPAKGVDAFDDGNDFDDHDGFGFEAADIHIEHSGSGQEITTDGVDIGDLAGSSTTGGDVDGIASTGSEDVQDASDSDDDSSPVKIPRPSSVDVYVALPGCDDGIDVYAMVQPATAYAVACVGDAVIPVIQGEAPEQLMLSVVTEHGIAHMLVTSVARPEIKSFMAELLHAVKFEGKFMTFTNIERGARLDYKFEFQDSTAANAFMQDLPDEIRERYSTIVDINTAVKTVVGDAIGGGCSVGGGSSVSGGDSAGGGGSAGGGSGASGGNSSDATKHNPNFKVYDAARILAAEATGDDSHLRANRSAKHALKTETWASR